MWLDCLKGCDESFYVTLVAIRLHLEYLAWLQERSSDPCSNILLPRTIRKSVRECMQIEMVILIDWEGQTYGALQVNRDQACTE
jgi:hypothetical protein